MRNGTAIVRHKNWIGLEACHIATLTQRQHSHALLHTYSFSLSLTYTLTLSNLISANCYSLRRRSAAIFASLSLYSLLFRIYQHFFRCHQSSLRPHAFTASQVTYVAFPSALPPLPSRNAFRKSANTNENEPCSILYIASVLCMWKYEYLLNICNKFVYINLVF